MFGHRVSSLQTGITVSDNAITGTLKYVSTGSLAETWGAGNFLALKFSDIDSDTVETKVGLVPSVSSGLVALDEDLNGVFKVTDKDNQVFHVEQIDADGNKHVQEFDLSGLTCNNE